MLYLRADPITGACPVTQLLPPFFRQYHAPYHEINQYVRRRQRQGKHIFLPKPGGVALGGLIRLHGDVGAVTGDAEHPAGDRHAFLHGLMTQLPGDGPVGSLVAAAVYGPVVDGLGEVHAVVAATRRGVLNLGRENLVESKSMGAVPPIAIYRQNYVHSNVSQAMLRSNQL